MADSLEMKASLKAEEFVKGAKQCMAALRELTGYGQTFHKQGAELAQKHTFKFDDLKKSMEGASKHIKDVLTPAIAGLGLTAISVGGAIAGITASVKSFGELSLHLTRLRTETGLSTTSLLAFEQAAVRFGSSAEAADAGFQRFASNMEQWNAGRGNFIHALTNQTPQIQSFVYALRGVGTEKGFKMVIEDLKQLRTVAGKKDFLTSLGLDPGFSLATQEELDEIIAKIRVLTPAEEEAGKAQALSWAKARESLQNLSIDIGARLAPAMTFITDKVREFVEGPGKEWIDWGIQLAKDHPQWVEAIALVAGAITGLTIAGGALALAFAAINLALAPEVAIFGALAATVGSLIVLYEKFGATREKYASNAMAGLSGPDKLPEGQSALSMGWGRLKGALGLGGDLPKMAKGGIIVGEAGPEAVIPLGGKLDPATEATSKLMLFTMQRLEEIWKNFTGQGQGAGQGGGSSGGAGASGGWGARSGGGGGLGGRAAVKGSGGPLAGKDDHSTDAELIRKLAKEQGVDPDVAVAVAKSEGGFKSWGGGDKGSSFGPLQAHFGGIAPGMMSKGQGDVMAAAGIDARDPNQKEKVLRWQLAYAKKHGWGEWYGAARVGIGRRQGLDGPAGPGEDHPISGKLSDFGSGNIPTPPSRPGAASGLASGGGDAPSFAETMLGHSPSDSDLRAYMSGQHVGNAAWCAAFVNASLDHAGMKGTGSNMAKSFLTWGRHVDFKDVQKGDVAVMNRGGGHPTAGGKGHVGIVEGAPVGGKVQTIEGNKGHKVAHGSHGSELEYRRYDGTTGKHDAPGAPSAGGGGGGGGGSGGGGCCGVGGAMSDAAGALGSKGILGALFGGGGVGNILSGLMGGIKGGAGAGGMLGGLFGAMGGAGAGGGGLGGIAKSLLSGQPGHGGGGPLGFLGGGLGKMMAGAMEHTVKGAADLHVKFHNAPAKINTHASSSGLFKSVQVHRGTALPRAQEA